MIPLLSQELHAVEAPKTYILPGNKDISSPGLSLSPVWRLCAGRLQRVATALLFWDWRLSPSQWRSSSLEQHLVGCEWMLPVLGSSLLFVLLLNLLSPVSFPKGFKTGLEKSFLPYDYFFTFHWDSVSQSRSKDSIGQSSSKCRCRPVTSQYERPGSCC